MSDARVILVHLRRPRNGPNESRSDPFWEFGSFGCTGCHARNILNPAKIEEVEGARLGFAQGGRNGFRLVHLTPPVSVTSHRDLCEALWKPCRMPFRYASAPLLIRNDGETDFPKLMRMISGVKRETWEAKLSSAIRTRRKPLPDAVGAQVAARFDDRLREAKRTERAAEYWEALPWAPPKIDEARPQTYARLRKAAGATARPSRNACAKPRRSRGC